MREGFESVKDFHAAQQLTGMGGVAAAEKTLRQQIQAVCVGFWVPIRRYLLDICVICMCGGMYLQEILAVCIGFWVPVRRYLLNVRVICMCGGMYPCASNVVLKNIVGMVLCIRMWCIGERVHIR